MSRAATAFIKLFSLFCIQLKQLELHTEGNLDVAVLILVQVTIKDLGHAQSVASLNKGVIGEVIGTTQAKTEVNGFGALLEVIGLNL